MLWAYLKAKGEKLTTLLQEFEEWLKEEYETSGEGLYSEAILNGLNKLEELKKKHNVV